MTAYRLLIVEDHRMFAEAVQSILSKLPEVGETKVVPEYPRILSTASGFSPSLIILDISVNQRSTIPLIQELKSLEPKPRILVVTMHNDAIVAQAALRAGADGYLLKDAGSGALTEAMRTVMIGQRYIEPSIAESLENAPVHVKDEGALLFERYEALTYREQEVFRLLAEGEKTGTVARNLGISRKTVDAHRYNVMRKLHASTTAELIRLSFRLGVVGPKE